MSEIVTFQEPAYAVMDKKNGQMRTNPFGQLAIFSTRNMAKAMIEGCSFGDRLEILEVWIRPNN